MVKPKATLKYPAAGVIVTAAVIKGRVRFFHVVEGRWNGAAAAKMYAELAKAMRRAFPEHAAKPRAKWLVMEDNDPTGYKSSAAEGKKTELSINVLRLPPRSPDLNVLDYYVWSAINKRLREQEAKFPANKKESKEAYLKRLRATDLGLPPSEVKDAMRSMRRRLRQIVDTGGYLIDG